MRMSLNLGGSLRSAQALRPTNVANNSLWGHLQSVEQGRLQISMTGIIYKVAVVC